MKAEMPAADHGWGLDRLHDRNGRGRAHLGVDLGRHRALGTVLKPVRQPGLVVAPVRDVGDGDLKAPILDTTTPKVHKSPRNIEQRDADHAIRHYK